ncbi:MAG: trypsin-like peptidase domain-containing protein [Saprospiraceae bacterium]|nr:trypsin-like peptidase domain-containing protein [Saprospiraceae bacterium]
MKTKQIIIGFFFILSNTLFGQTFNFPKCQSDPDLKIIDVIRDDYSTVINFEYKRSSSPDIYIYLNSPSTADAFYIKTHNKSYKLIGSKGIGNADGITPARLNIPLKFSATFEPIPTYVTQFDLIEGSNGTWNIYNIPLKPTQSSTTFCDKINFNINYDKPTFSKFLSGVRHAVIYCSPTIRGHKPAFSALFDYLKGMGFESVKYSKDDDSNTISSSEKVSIFLYFTYDLYNFSDIKLEFYSQTNGVNWNFSSSKIVKDELNSSNTKSNFYKALIDMYGYKKAPFDKKNSMPIIKIQTCWTEEKLQKEIELNGCNKIEGIYEVTKSSTTSPRYRVAVRKINGSYYLVYLSGARNYMDWSEGEIKAFLEETATPLLFKATIVMENKLMDDNYFIKFGKGYFDLISIDNESSMYLKMFPTASNNSELYKEPISSGTGFAISSDGYIVTNHHVTNGAESINVKGVNGDFSKVYSAKIIVEDQKNDLSIIQINSPSFTSLGTIPYTIANRPSDVGSSVFVLGYPLRSSMGDEVKLTNGIISSKSGFQGDITSYQITAPVQPGNSGGPLFGENGNILAIINAKHGDAENASYAIKSSYLLNLIDLLPKPTTLQNKNSVSGMTLSEQVKILKKYIYIIETN